MSALDDLYKEVILDHYRRPRHYGTLPIPPASSAKGFNPLCGDEVDVYVTVSADDRIDDVTFEGKGCAISQASASMMTEQTRNRTTKEVSERLDRFKSMLGIPTEDCATFLSEQSAGSQLGDAEALQDVRQFPSRIRCATLAWNTLERAIAGQATYTETEP